LTTVCHFLQLLPVTFQSSLKLLILFLKRHHFPLCIVLLLLALLQLCLSSLNFLLDISEEQVLIEGMDLTYVVISILQRWN